MLLKSLKKKQYSPWLLSGSSVSVTAFLLGLVPELEPALGQKCTRSEPARVSTGREQNPLRHQHVTAITCYLLWKESVDLFSRPKNPEHKKGEKLSNPTIQYCVVHSLCNAFSALHF